MNCLVFRLSENSGSYYSHIYPCLMNGAISAKTDRDISLSQKKRWYFGAFGATMAKQMWAPDCPPTSAPLPAALMSVADRSKLLMTSD